MPGKTLMDMQCDKKMITNGRINWSQVVETACETEDEKVLLLGSFLTENLYGARMLHEIPKRVKNDKSLLKI